MSNNQVIYINLGLKWTDGDNSGEFNQELGRFLVETKFPHCGIISEPYNSTWTDSSGTVYEETCLAFKITVPSIHAFQVARIEEKINGLRVMLKQEAIAFHTYYGNADYSNVYYGPEKPENGLIFDAKYFHYVK
jgi:hypothetical protein